MKKRIWSYSAFGVSIWGQAGFANAL